MVGDVDFVVVVLFFDDFVCLLWDEDDVCEDGGDCYLLFCFGFWDDVIEVDCWECDDDEVEGVVEWFDVGIYLVFEWVEYFCGDEEDGEYC